MNKINKEEMFQNLKGFLKSKGIELQDGAYTQRIRNGCGILTDTVNLSQDAVGRAKAAVDKGLDQLRQAVHERTAPRSASASTDKAKPTANTSAKRNSSGPTAQKTKTNSRNRRTKGRS